MEHNKQHTNLDSYLDGELTPLEIETFESALQADENLQAELESRQMDREIFRLALGEKISADDFSLDSIALQEPAVQKTGRRIPALASIGLATAACLCLVILVPRMLRNDSGAEGPRSVLTISGQVTALRHGEIPGETAMLETGFLELPAGLSR